MPFPSVPGFRPGVSSTGTENDGTLFQILNAPTGRSDAAIEIDATIGASDKWKSNLLDIVFEAIAAHAPLRKILIFKGARVLNRLLKTHRQSFDLDSNLTETFDFSSPNRLAQMKFFESQMKEALSRFFQKSKEQNLELGPVKVEQKPKLGHPLKWDAFYVRIAVKDRSKANVLGLPTLDLDIAAPEELSPKSVADLEVGGHIVQAYTLERIAGEKLRAFLTSLPIYRKKLNGTDRTPRVKDLYDLTRIYRARSISDCAFWLLGVAPKRVPNV